jgi:peptidoglycan/LPS O-acetylase OafA/YrhL
MQNTHPAYRPDIDGLRAIAVLAVVLFHAFPGTVSGGFVGVDVFFVISGFLITGIIAAEMDTGGFSFAHFYARRIRRLFPALIIVLAACLIFGWYALLTDEYRMLGKHAFMASIFASNFAFWNEAGYFDTAVKPLLHLWTLGVEEQFYLVWPFILFLSFRKYALPLLCVLFIGSFLLNAGTIHSYPVSAFFLPTTRFWEFLTGAFLALNKRQYPFADLRSLIGFVLIAAAVFLIDKNKLFPGWWALLPNLGAGLIISAESSAWLNRNILSRPALVFIGLISYPIYLWHWPLLAFATIEGWASAYTRIVLILVSVILAAATYFLIEKPVRRGRIKHATALLAVLATAVGLAGYCAWHGMPRSASNPELQKILKAAGEWEYPGTLVQFEFNGTPMFRHGDEQKKILFFGDSMIEQYWPRISELITRNPDHVRSLIFATSGGCAPIPNIRESQHPGCDDFVDHVREFVRQRQDIDTIVLAAQWYGYLMDSTYFYEKDGFSDRLKLGSQGASKAYSALEEMLAEFRKNKKRVYIILNSPIGSELNPRNMILRDVFHGGFQIHTALLERSMVMQQFAPVNAKIREAGEHVGAIIIDPIKTLCDEKTCPLVTKDGEPIYKDEVHLRPYYVKDHVLFLDKIVKKHSADY